MSLAERRTVGVAAALLGDAEAAAGKGFSDAGQQIGRWREVSNKARGSVVTTIHFIEIVGKP